MKNYYIYNGSEQVGPLEFDEVKVQKLSRKTPVWHQGLSDWTPIEKVPELLPLLTTPPPFKNTLVNNTPKEDEAVVADDFMKPQQNFKGVYIVVSLLVVVLVSWFMHYNSTHNLNNMGNQLIDEQEQNDQYQKEQQQRIDEELNRINMNYRNNWDKYISAGSSDYVASSLGGIYGLEVVITNNTDNMIDEVVAAVSYLKANGTVWKQVKVRTDSINAHSTKAIPVQDVEKGVAVTVSIDSVRSMQMNFLYAPGYFSGNVADPNFYK
jgi:type II secretory pathway pseudopilin PulG